MIVPLLLSAAAIAGPFTRKASMDDWPGRQVQRDFVLPRGWLQVGLSADTKRSTGYRNKAGEVEEWAAGTTWRYSRYQLRIDQGFSHFIRLYAHLPFVVAGLSNNEGADVHTAALGDIHTGLWMQPWIGHAAGVAFRLDLKSPSGVEWPGSFIGGPDNMESFLTGTGITNLGGHLHARLGMGRVAELALSGGYVFKFPSVVGYLVEPYGFGNGWLDPGDELLATGRLTFQVHDDIAISGDASYSRRGAYAMGNSGQSASELELSEISGSAGAYLDAGGAVSWEPVENVEARLHMGAQVLGDDTRTWAHLGLEEFSPQPGLTTGLEVDVRW